MGRQSSAKQQSGARQTTPPPSSGKSPLLIILALVAVAGIGLFAFWPGADETTSATTPTEAADPNAPAAAKWTEPTPEIVAGTEAIAKIGAHKQANLPPIPFAAYAPPRPPEVVTAAFHFAAEHPEITSYVPCFCGCQHANHKGNHDCFVKSRAANGDVTEWEPHGVECAVCIDVATRSRQLLASGASVRDIRAAIEKEFAPAFPTMTPTPKPAAHTSH
jgi:hypothetical protein